MKRFLASIWEVVEVVLISVVTVLIIRNFLAQPFLVSGASMEPNFSNGNYLIVDEITYRLRDPQRGEVIVFRYPRDRSVYFIKRIVGLPGDRVVIKNNQATVFSGGQEIQIAGETNGLVDLVLETDKYFVLGDNRYNSLDSRNWGTLSRKDIIGIARLKVLPISDFQIISYGPESL